jgi:peptide deformylase
MSEIKPIDGVFKLDTADALTSVVQPTVETIETFDLVAPDDPILREVMPHFDFENAIINPSDFASSLVETCKKNNGVGLSANQCGFPYRVFVMGAGDNYVAHFNPEVIETSGEAHMLEGCLSFPLLGFRITRPSEIVVKYQDFNGVEHTTKYTGISARCFLHELDHMNGVVYTDRVKPLALKSGLDKRNKVIKKMAQYQALMMKQAKQKNGKNSARVR